MHTPIILVGRADGDDLKNTDGASILPSRSPPWSAKRVNIRLMVLSGMGASRRRASDPVP